MITTKNLSLIFILFLLIHTVFSDNTTPAENLEFSYTYDAFSSYKLTFTGTNLGGITLVKFGTASDVIGPCTLDNTGPVEETATGFTCTVDIEGNGIDLDVYSFKGDGLQTKAKQLFSFAPRITRVEFDPETSKVTVHAGNFKEGSSLLIGDTQSVVPSTTFSPDTNTITFLVEKSQNNGQLFIKSGDLNSKTDPAHPSFSLLALTPKITKVNSLPLSGGKLEITGEFLNIKNVDNKDTTFNLLVLVDETTKVNCKNPAALDGNVKIQCDLDPVDIGKALYSTPYDISLKIDEIEATGGEGVFKYEDPTAPASADLKFEVTYEQYGVYKFKFTGGNLVGTTSIFVSENVNWPCLLDPGNNPVPAGATEFTCTFTEPQGEGYDRLVQVFKEEGNEDTMTPATNLFNFAPRVSRVEFNTNTFLVSVLGVNLDSDSKLYFGTESNEVQNPALSENEFTFTAPSTQTNGPFFVTSNGYKSLMDPANELGNVLLLDPIVTNTNNLPFTGGKLEITGKFLNLKNYNNQDTQFAFSIKIDETTQVQCKNPVSLDGNVKIQCDLDPVESGKAQIDTPYDIIFTNDDVPAIVDKGIFKYIEVVQTAPILKDVKIITAPTLTLTLDPTTITATTKIDAIKMDQAPILGEIKTFDPVTGQIEIDLPSTTLPGPKKFIVNADGQDSNEIESTISPSIVSMESTVTEGGVPSVIKGYFFGSDKADIKVTMGTLDCPVVDNPTEDGSMLKTTCTVPAAPETGSGLNIKTTLANKLISSQEFTFKYGPKITAINHSGDNKLTVTGINFDEVTTLTIGTQTTTPISRTPDTSDQKETQVEFTIGLELKNDKQLSVTSNGVPSNQLELKLTPFLRETTSVSDAGGKIVITGNYLNTKRSSDEDTVVEVSIGTEAQQLKCLSPKNDDIQDNTKLSCLLDSGSADKYPMVVTIDQVPSKGSVTYSTLVKMAVNDVIQELNYVKINGKGFGDDVTALQITLTGTTLNKCEFDKNQDGVVNKDIIKCPLPWDSKSGPVIVTLGTQVSEEKQLIVLPYVESMTAAKSNTDKIELKVWFLLDTDTESTISCIIGATPSTKTELVRGTGESDPNKVLCTIPTDSDAQVSETTPLIGITTTTPAPPTEPTAAATSRDSINKIKFVYSEPVISTFEQKGFNLVISGNTLGNSDFNEPVATLGEVSLTDCKRSKPQVEITCTIPAATAKNGILTVKTPPTVASSNELPVTLIPLLQSISSAPTQGGLVTLTVNLINDFIGTPDQLKNVIITIDGATDKCTDLKFVETGFTCIISDKIKPDASVTVTVPTSTIGTSTAISNEAKFNYLEPTLTSYVHDNYKLTLEGTNFGVKSINDVLKVVIRPTSGSSVEISCTQTTDHTKAECDLKDIADKVKNGDSSIVRNTLYSKDALYMKFTPVIRNITSKVPFEGGDIEIEGDFLNFVNINNQAVPILPNTSYGECTDVKSVDSRNFKCQVPKGSHGLYNNFYVVLDGQQSNSFNYSAEEPDVDEVYSPQKLYYKKGGLLVIIGENFYPSPIKITIGKAPRPTKECKHVNFINSTRIQCYYDGSIKMEDEDEEDGLYVEVECDGLKGGDEKLKYDVEVKKSKWWIALIVVFGTIGIGLAVGGGYLIRKRMLAKRKDIYVNLREL
eukprot:gene5198-6473_t